MGALYEIRVATTDNSLAIDAGTVAQTEARRLGNMPKNSVLP